MHTAQANARALLSAMMAGACGFLIKPVAPADLLPHLDKALVGGLALCARAERLLLESLCGLARAGTACGLSRREEELMLCLCHHGSNKNIATALGISEATVHAHLATIFTKLNVHDRESALCVFMRKFFRVSVRLSGVAADTRPFLDLLPYCYSARFRCKWMRMNNRSEATAMLNQRSESRTMGEECCCLNNMRQAGVSLMMYAQVSCDWPAPIPFYTIAGIAF